MTRSNHSLPALQELPKTYLHVELKNGNAVIPRDFFVSMCPKKLTDDWAVMSITLAPYFETAAIDNNTNVADANHATGKDCGRTEGVVAQGN